MPCMLFAGLVFIGACAPEEKPQDPQESAKTKEQAIAEQKLASGQTVYEAHCAGCHDAGVSGAPKPGDKAEWTYRIELGVDSLAKKSIDGFEGKQGVMPAKGGSDALTDEEVTNAVIYMVEKSK